MAHYPYCFTIDSLRMMAHLGWQAPERSVRQPVTVDMRLYFPSALVALSDDDGGFLDYHGLCKTIQAQIESREFRLIEFMASELFAAARAFADAHQCDDVRIWLRLRKCTPPVEYLENGASFVMSDLPEGATTIAAV